MKREAGELSVFLALISLLTLSLLCTCLESARTAGLGYLCRQASGSALQSLFSAFNTPVLDRYGLLMCDGKAAESRLSDYASRYFRTGEGPLDDLGIVQLTGVSVQSVGICDDNGRIFADQLLRYMKGAGLTLLFQEALSRLGIRNLSELSSLSDSLSRLLEGDSFDFRNLFSNLEKLKEIAAQQRAEESDPEPESSVSEELTDFFADAKSISEYLERLKDLKEHGLIYYLTGSTSLSAAAYGNERPSQLSDEEKRRNSGIGQTAYSLMDRLLLTEYALHKLGCYTAQPAEGCRYELEYVLSGKAGDREALQAAAEELLLLRTGLNFSYLLSDAERLKEAEAAALAFCSALGIPELSGTAKWLIAAAWSLSEALSDVKGLLKGHRVPLWKSSSSWNTALLSLPDASPAGSSGLLYADYLRLLFYLKWGPALSYHLMDVLQRRTRILQQDFRMSDQIIFASAEYTFTAEPFYLVTPLISALPAGSAWKYTKKAAFGYERR